MKAFALLLPAIFLASTLFAQDPAHIPPKVELKDGDTFLFLGDSITHQCLYTQYVESYFYTRYPNRRIRFYNAGVSGDRADDALLRFETDVSMHKPNYVSILLGMNDGTYRHFDHETFQIYEKGMGKLLDKVDSIGATPIPMAPSLFDSRALNPKVAKWIKARDDARNYYNPLLSFYGAWLQEQALQRGLNYVDMNAPLARITQDQRRKDPNFTLIKDAVHPDEPGQVVMATAMLNDLFVKSPVSRIKILRDAQGSPKAAGKDHGVSEIYQVGKDGSLEFTHLAKSLPWVVPEEAQPGYKLAKAGHKFSSERVQVVGLQPGNYKLTIDGAEISTYTDSALARGVEIQENPNTPQYQQALKVANLNKARNKEAVYPLRELYRDLKRRRRNGQDVSAYLPEFKEKTKAAIAKTVVYEDKIYQANQPKPHKYKLQRLR